MSEPKLKITMLGGGGVGKSQLTLAYLKEKFQDGYDPTIENSYVIKTKINDITYNVSLVDTAGQDEFRALMSTWIKDSDCFIFCYDMTSKTSIQDAEEIIQMAQSHKEHELQIPGLPFAPCVLVGCKCDLKDQIENKTTMEAKEMAKKQFFLIGTPDETKLKQMPYFFETSAKENINIQEVYDSVIAQYAERLKYSAKILAKKPKKGLFTSVSHTTKEEVEEDLGALDL